MSDSVNLPANKNGKSTKLTAYIFPLQLSHVKLNKKLHITRRV